MFALEKGSLCLEKARAQAKLQVGRSLVFPVGKQSDFSSWCVDCFELPSNWETRHKREGLSQACEQPHQ